MNIRLGDGFGNFNNAGDVSIGANPNSIAVSDFNNDGNQDFATANGANPNTVSIRFGNGLGGFNGTGNVNVGSNPFNIAIGDFNNDGKQDFVTANRGANNLSIRLSTCVTTPTPSNVCTPSTTVTEGDLFPGGIVSFGVTSGAGSVTVDHVNAGTGLQSLTIVGTPINAIVNIPAFTSGTQMPVVITFTPINPGLAVDFTLRAASTFHAANIRARCAEVCTPSTTVTEGDLFPGGIVSFGISSGAGSVTVDHVNAGTGTQSLTVVGTPINAVVNIPPFTAGTTMPIVVTFTPIDPNQPVDFTLRAASTFHAANVRVRCGTQVPISKLK